MTGASLACSAIRARVPDARILMLGGHVAALPERTLADEACDFVAHDEGLHTIVDLLEADRQGDRSLDKIRGLAYWQSGTLRQIRSNAAAPLVRDLEHDMPGVAWDLLPMDKYQGPQLALLRSAGARAVRRHLHHARVPFQVLVLLHPGAVQGW